MNLPRSGKGRGSPAPGVGKCTGRAGGGARGPCLPRRASYIALRPFVRAGPCLSGRSPQEVDNIVARTGPDRRAGRGRDAQPQVLLDWATISYRSIMRSVVLFVLLVAAGGAFYWFRSSLKGSPEELALVDIGRAERLYREAQAA